MEVIDLVSSSPSPIIQPTVASKAFSSTKTASLPSRKSTAQNPRKAGKGNDEWFCLSDDLDTDVNPTTTAGPHPSITLNTAPEKPTTKLNDYSDDDFWNLDNGLTNNVHNTTTNHAEVATLPEGGSATKAQGDNDFFFLSDDFDTTVNLDETFGLDAEPAKKKRRLTPEPPTRTGTNITSGKSVGLKRAASDIAAGSIKSTTGIGKGIGLKRSKTSILDEDPILFTSSPDLGRAVKDLKGKSRVARDLEYDDDDLFADYGTLPKLSKGTSDIYNDNEAGIVHDVSSELDLPDLGTISSRTSLSKVPALSRVDSNKALATYNAERSARQKDQDKARKAQEKLDAKEAEKERKRLAKEDKAREKQMAADLAKVNTLRIDKKVSTPEMIVDLPVDLEPRLAGQVRQFLKPLDVECTEWTSPIPNVIKWRRKVEAIYNEEKDHWEPTSKHIKDEKHVMCIMTAKGFVDLATGDEGQDLDAHVLRMKSKFDNCTIIYLLEGLTAWQRKNRNVKNRQFTEAVRNQMPNDAAPSSQRPKKQKMQEYIDEDMIEDALLRLQVMHNALIHQTTAPVQTAEWITTFTQHISTIPYRHQRQALSSTAAFCMETGQVKTGTDVADTWVKMLQEINRVTAPIAYGIAAEYGSVGKLVKGFEGGGRDVLEGVRKGANRDGAFADREVGRRVSRRLWGIFMGRDEGSLDV
jgi:crossover junction endonuclease EME1